MDSDEAADRLAQAHRLNRLSAKRGAWITAIVTSIAVLAIGAVVDLNMVWLAGLIVLGLAGLWTARPLRSRLDWSNRVGACLVVGGGILAIATYIVVQFPLRSAEVTTPNTIGALAAGVVILVVCRAGLQRLASATPSTGKAC